MKEKIKDRLIIVTAILAWLFVSALAGWFTRNTHEIPMSFLASSILCAAILGMVIFLILLVCALDQPY